LLDTAEYVPRAHVKVANPRFALLLPLN